MGTPRHRKRARDYLHCFRWYIDYFCYWKCILKKDSSGIKRYILRNLIKDFSSSALPLSFSLSLLFPILFSNNIFLLISVLSSPLLLYLRARVYLQLDVHFISFSANDALELYFSRRISPPCLFKNVNSFKNLPGKFYFLFLLAESREHSSL